MIEVVETEEVKPVCPHCEKELTSVFAQLMSTVFGKRYIYFCGLCKKVLGVTQRKGFWMG